MQHAITSISGRPAIGLRIAATVGRAGLRHAEATCAPGPATATKRHPDLLTRTAEELVRVVRGRLASEPLRGIREGIRTRWRVLGALDYVVDPERRAVWVEPSPATVRRKRSGRASPWQAPGKDDRFDIDLLNPLHKPAWLVYVAAQPGWIGPGWESHEAGQPDLLQAGLDVSKALPAICDRAFRMLRCDRALIELRRNLARSLVLNVGQGLVALALRARYNTRGVKLSAFHAGRVWQHRAAYERLAQENSKLLPALSAWLVSGGKLGAEEDAAQAMRCSLLASGLQPRAWRELAAHGARRFLVRRLHWLPWQGIVEALQALERARWPAVPPLDFLQLLSDAAGLPRPAGDCPGWFWRMLCNEAHGLRDDPVAYTMLMQEVPWLARAVREHPVRPDKNQRRRGLDWLRAWADRNQTLAMLDGKPSWALWMLGARWPASPAFEAVPLLSSLALMLEATAMHNCADSYEEDCRKGRYLLVSLRKRSSGHRVALVGCLFTGADWTIAEVAGPCNQPVSEAVRQAARQALGWVRCHHRLAIEHPGIGIEGSQGQTYPVPECGITSR